MPTQYNKYTYDDSTHKTTTTIYRNTRQDRWIQTELVSTLVKNAKKPNPFEIIPLQTTRKENNWKDRRNVGESSCNFRDGPDQRVQFLMFMMMMMMMISYTYQNKLYHIPEELSVRLYLRRKSETSQTNTVHQSVRVCYNESFQTKVAARLTTKFHIWPKRHRYWAQKFFISLSGTRNDTDFEQRIDSELPKLFGHRMRATARHGTIRTVHTTYAAALKTTTHPKTRCTKPYAATRHLMLLMIGVFTPTTSS